MTEGGLRLFIIAGSGVIALVFAFVSASLWLNGGSSPYSMAWTVLVSAYFAAMAIWEVKS